MGAGRAGGRGGMRGGCRVVMRGLGRVGRWALLVWKRVVWRVGLMDVCKVVPKAGLKVVTKVALKVVCWAERKGWMGRRRAGRRVWL